MEANETHDTQSEIMLRMLWLGRKHHQLHNQSLQELGFLSGQVPILLILDREGPLSQRELAKRANITAATVSATLKRMEKAGSIRREGIQEDARVSVVRLTEAGLADVNRVHEKFDTLNHDIFSCLTDGEMSELNACLARVQQRITAMMEIGENP